MRIIGITGGIGSGKSTVTSMLRERGYTVVDADELSREVCKKGTPLLRLLVREFGIEIIKEDGTLDRSKLADLAFETQQGTRRLNELVQTAILVRAMEFFNRLKLSGDIDVCFFDVPMLYEAGWDRYTDSVWLVTAPQQIRLKRVVKRDRSRKQEVLARMKLQMSEEEKMSRADVVLDNSGTEAELKAQVERAIEAL
ncbi:MAG TPA: dephospho-CoA kinase [Clostridiales bacterium]|jgi:dephospho-CoA kinase|nr:dephospho-CoA kinase [Clostridiales bacterium]